MSVPGPQFSRDSFLISINQRGCRKIRCALLDNLHIILRLDGLVGDVGFGISRENSSQDQLGFGFKRDGLHFQSGNFIDVHALSGESLNLAQVSRPMNGIRGLSKPISCPNDMLACGVMLEKDRQTHQ